MKKFFVLYMAKSADFKKVVAGMKKMDKSQMEKMNKDWGVWAKKVKMVDMGAPVGKNMRVSKSGVKNARNEVGGYSIIAAKTHEEAARKMKTNPHFKMMPKGWVEVMEILPM
jgi:hypothetical protein